MTSRTVASIIVSCALVSGVVRAQWLNYPTPGIPRLPDGKPNLSAPTPRAPDGRPDLSGLWRAECSAETECFSRSLFFDLARDVTPEAIQMTPWAASIQKQRESREAVDDPVGYCLPHGYPRMAFPAPFKVLQTPTLTAFLHEAYPGSVFRQVFTDGRPLPRNFEPAWLGYSVGRWDNDTFVVETSGFRDRGWLDQKGRPHSDALRLIERFRRTDFGHLDWAITVEDPKAYLKPWTINARLGLLADSELLESFCETHDKTMEHRRITPPPPEPPSPPLP